MPTDDEPLPEEAPRLRATAGFKSKREHVNSCTPCMTLKPELGCGDMCCRSYLVILAQEDLDDGLVTLSPFLDVLAKRPNGGCYYLDDDSGTGACGVWEDRPLVCRVYDCRADDRAKLRFRVPHPRGTFFVRSHPTTCTHCGRALRLCAGVMPQTGGRPVCVDCGEPYELTYNYAGQLFHLAPVAGVGRLERRLNLLRCLCYREQWAGALALLEEWAVEAPGVLELRRHRAVMLGELGRLPEARRELEALADAEPGVALDLAWLDTRQGADPAAQRRLEAVLGVLGPEERLRANLQLGSIARRAGRVEDAALRFQQALLLDKQYPTHLPGIREYLLELVHGSDEVRARVERALVHAARQGN